ncbi:MAG TPA: molybdenum cofactor guanylyltransferase [Terracidiphilus sp.]|nr:molybdenum cofactor guanylyltransferase [Terracidiphilus sp.]
MTLPVACGHGSAAGFVLAGGESSRMGRDKALVELDGRPLVEHVLGTLRESGLEARIAGARSDLKSYAPVIEDPGGGPLSGICAALASCEAELAVFVPVDMPLVPPKLLEYLVFHARMTGAAVTVPSALGRAETFPAVVDRLALPVLQETLEAHTGGCFAAFARAAERLGRPIAVVAVEELAQCGQVMHPLGVPAGQWLRNVNTPEDLTLAEALVCGNFA